MNIPRSPHQFTVLALLICLGALSSFGCGSIGQHEVTINKVVFTVELADTPSKRAQGLSNRSNLTPKTGMLFAFNQEGGFPFWMKNMRFPVDFVWIDKRCMINQITQAVPPPAANTPDANLLIYRPQKPFIYMLEINAGETSQFEIKAGDQVSFRHFPSSQGC